MMKTPSNGLFAGIIVSVVVLWGSLFPAPGMAFMLDLTFDGASGTINNAIFEEGTIHPAGEGVFEPFVRIQNKPQEQGYNTDGPLEFDTKQGHTGPKTWTHSLLVGDLMTVTKNGHRYREFALDINQKNNATGRLLSLDQLKIYLEDTPDLTGYPSHFGSPIYDLDAGGDNWIKLDYNLNSGGSGWADMFAFIPDDLFTDHTQYLYLFSSFGEQNRRCCGSNSGFEEWRAREAEAQVPEPASLILLGSGLVLLGLWGRRGFRRISYHGA